ncbi:MAG: hypothetical protein P1U50_14365 [Parvibaculaceae bacterium]|nr:hypothetical protein [Parvibaculaceae bacterium]
MARAKVGDERRGQILAAFEACVVRDGLAKTTLQKIADEAALPRSLVRYFIGNRDEMVNVLIDAMMARAEQEMAEVYLAGKALSPRELVSFVFDSLFDNDTTNGVVSELWLLAQRDEVVKERLAKLYERMQDEIMSQMALAGFGRSKAARKRVAYALMSLGYGDASYKFLTNSFEQKGALKQVALGMVERLKAEGQKNEK